MLKNLISKIWRTTPRFARLRIIRLTQKKFTASVAAVIINEERKVLLLDHVLRPHSSWGLPGGFIEAGEQPENAIRREIYEEVGLKLEDTKMFRVQTLGSHIEILFTAKASGSGEIKSREIRDMGWFEIDEMPGNMTSAQKSIVRNVLNKELKK